LSRPVFVPPEAAVPIRAQAPVPVAPVSFSPVRHARYVRAPVTGSRSKRATASSAGEAAYSDVPSSLTATERSLSSPELTPKDVALEIWAQAFVPDGPLSISPVMQPW
jgi:hypothetical protein